MSVPVCWAIFVFFMHSIPGFDIRYEDPWQIFKFDKLAHVALFAVLVITSVVGFRKQVYIRGLRAYPRFWAVSFALVYGGLLEYYQGALFVQRASDPVDFLANSLGVLVGLLSFRVIYGKELSRQL